ncbi:hypothetical protein [Actinoplanes rectilineatus]|uniref:hypothetical protein n=1 Tax=Actinoplanes rectilineatus TaxID=113571 RepID=UPI0005F27CF4|nr:hypothetical protein [Actinoplanes rectilineatus]
MADQVNFFLGGGPDCEENTTTVPAVRTAEVVEIPSFAGFCVEGFDHRRDLTVTVTGPGPSRTARTDWDTLMAVRWPILPGNPTGRHRVRITQGSRSASATFTVVRATAPRLWINPRVAYAGDTVDVYLGGFPAETSADLHLYATSSLNYRATTTVPVDHHGEAHLVLRTSRSTTPDAYAMNSPLIYIPPPDFEPGEFGGPENSVLWLYGPR